MTAVLTEEAAKAKARALSKGLTELGVSLRHTQVLELIARLEGETSWSALNAKQRRRGRGAKAPAPVPIKAALAPVPHLVGSENLLPGHVQVDEVPCSTFGDTRKSCLYSAMRVTGIPSIYWHPVVDAVQELGGFSAPAVRLPRPQGDEKYDDDTEPCNRFGNTRLQVLMRVLDTTRLDEREVDGLVAEYRARSGLIPCWQGSPGHG